jgi:hypothetical protein
MRQRVAAIQRTSPTPSKRFWGIFKTLKTPYFHEKYRFYG